MPLDQCQIDPLYPSHSSDFSKSLKLSFVIDTIPPDHFTVHLNQIQSPRGRKTLIRDVITNALYRTLSRLLFGPVFVCAVIRLLGQVSQSAIVTNRIDRKYQFVAAFFFTSAIYNTKAKKLLPYLQNAP